MSAVELLAPQETGPEHPRWHELRRQGVSASEIAIVMGISPYGSPFSLYWQKINGWDWDGNEYTGVGSHLEDAIADWWLAKTDGRDLIDGLAGLYAHPDRPWQLATPDRLLYLACDSCGGCGGVGMDPCADCMMQGHMDELVALLECKWIGAPTWEGWGEPGTDQIPVYYRAQGLWQLDTLGVDEVHFCALGPGGFRSYLVRRDEADLALMRAAGEDFVRRLKEEDPPPLDSHTATLETLQRLHPELGQGDVEVPVELAERYRVARADRKAADDRVSLCEAEIRAALGGDYNRAIVGKKLVASRSIYRQSGDSAELASIDDDWPVVDRLNPGRAATYLPEPKK